MTESNNLIASILTNIESSYGVNLAGTTSTNRRKVKPTETETEKIERVKGVLAALERAEANGKLWVKNLNLERDTKDAIRRKACASEAIPSEYWGAYRNYTNRATEAGEQVKDFEDWITSSWIYGKDPEFKYTHIEEAIGLVSDHLDELEMDYYDWD